MVLVKFKYVCITWGLLLCSLIGMMYKMNKLENIITTLNYNQTLILRQLEESEREISDIDKLIDKYSKQFGVDKKLAHAVAIVESGKKQEIVSPSNSIGIFQLQPSTAKGLGVNPYNVEQNILGGIKYLSYLDKKYNGDTDLILAGYNSGIGNVNKYNGIPPFSETHSYIKKVKKEKAKLENKI